MEASKIEWTDCTFNPWIGCSKVSAACRACYAETLMSKRYKRVEWGPGKPRLRTKEATWAQPRAWNRKAEKNGTRLRVFSASLADIFDAEVPEEWRDDFWSLVSETPHLDWLVLTKRPENIKPMLPNDWGTGWSNVWLGTTVEDQGAADARLPQLLEVPAVVRFLSCEPLLEPVILRGCTGLDWVIAGGETGADARPTDPTWVRLLRAQCLGSRTAFFFKQWGDHDATGKRVGKHRAGRLLDGRTWDEFPTPAESRRPRRSSSRFGSPSPARTSARISVE